MKKAEAVAKANPGLMKQKVKVKDYEKLDKINKKAEADLKKCKTKEQVDNVMDKYRKQRNVVLAAGAVAVVTLGVCYTHAKRKGNKAVEELNNQLAATETELASLKKENDKLVKNAENVSKYAKALQKEKDRNADLTHHLKTSHETNEKLNAENKEWFDKYMDAERKNADLDWNNKELERQMAVAEARIEVFKHGTTDAVTQTSEFASNWMKVGVMAERANQARKEAIEKDRAHVALKNSGGDPDKIAGAYKSYKTARKAEEKATGKLSDAYDTAIFTGDKVYKKLVDNLSAAERAYKTGRDSSGHDVDPGTALTRRSMARQDLERYVNSKRNSKKMYSTMSERK